MMTDAVFEQGLDEACICDDPFAAGGGYSDACPAHEVHRVISAALPPLDPFAQALCRLAQGHFRHDPPGPSPSPSGLCGACGGTGEVYRGTGETGHIFDGACGCETPYCGGCGEAWPCGDIRIITDAAKGDC